MAIGEVIMLGLLCAVLGAVMLVGGTHWVENREGKASEARVRKLQYLLAGVCSLNCLAVAGAVYWALEESRALYELRLLGIVICLLSTLLLIGGLYWVKHRI